MKRPVYLLVLILICCGHLRAQQIIPLYPAGVPDPSGINEKPGAYTGSEAPTLEVYLPEKGRESRTAVLIFPGGSYMDLSYQQEGSDIGKLFAKRGVAAFVVKYRLPVGYWIPKPKVPVSGKRYLVSLQDAQQAIKQVRINSATLNIDSDKIGVIGFSAGGHLASSLGTHFKQSYIPNKENTSLRPDFMILVYPVISMKEELAEAGSKYYLLGERPSPEKVKFFSNEVQVTKETPPTYLTHAGDDKLVRVDNSIVFYRSLMRNKVPAEMHLFPKGGHSFVLFLPPAEWMDPMLLWMKKMGLYMVK